MQIHFKTKAEPGAAEIAGIGPHVSAMVEHCLARQRQAKTESIPFA